MHFTLRRIFDQELLESFDPLLKNKNILNDIEPILNEICDESYHHF